jgi:hypothetical protein
MLAVSQGDRITGGKGFLQSLIKLFIDGGFDVSWNRFGPLFAVHSFAFNASSNRRCCPGLIRLFESLVYVILGNAHFGVALLVQVLLLGAVAHHAGMQGIYLPVS